MIQITSDQQDATLTKQIASNNEMDKLPIIDVTKEPQQNVITDNIYYGKKTNVLPSIIYIESEESKKYVKPKTYDIVPQIVQVNNSSKKKPHSKLSQSPKKVKVITVESTFGIDKKKERGGKNNIDGLYIINKGNNKIENLKKLSKIDIYNPRYLEMLDKNRNRYALVFKNLDLYSDYELDNKLRKLGDKRISDLLKINKELIGMITDCSLVVDPLKESPGRSCRRFVTPLYKEADRIRLLRKLEPRMKKPKHISRARHEIVVNNLHVIEDELITKEEYEIAEGSKIMSWIENNLVYYGGYNTQYYNQMMFADLVTYQNKGHIYITRGGIREPSLVKPELINLKYLTNQYNKPINVSQLIIHIQTSDNLVIDNRIPGQTKNNMKENADVIKVEAEKIMALEYFICLQPEPRFMLYILKRLIIAWYADLDLIDSITKIRLLINQYRARRDKKDNLKWGVLPSILIYLRYGSTMFNKALSKINYYFTNYIHMGWIGNEPDYFTKYNDLIYYSNGSPDAKRFFEHLPISKKMEIYKPYTINPTAFLKYGEDIVTPYPETYNKLYKLKYRSKFDLQNELQKTGEVMSPEDIDRYMQYLTEEKK